MRYGEYGFDDSRNADQKVKRDDVRTAPVSVHVPRFLDRLCRLWPELRKSGGTPYAELNGLLSGLVNEHNRFRAATAGTPEELRRIYGFEGDR